MSDHLNLALVDVDGAVREAEAGVAGDTRAQFFKKAAVGGGSLLAGSAVLGVLAEQSWGAPSAKQDVEILNYALTLEFLEAAFYKQALSGISFTDDQAKNFNTVVSGHETKHVAFLKGALGKAAIKEPKFDFGDTVTDQAKFLATSQVLENTGVMAYSGQATRIKSTKIVKAAVSILTVEARHAGWVGQLLGQKQTLGTFDKPKTMAQVLAAVKKTGFIKS